MDNSKHPNNQHPNYQYNNEAPSNPTNGYPSNYNDLYGHLYNGGGFHSPPRPVAQHRSNSRDVSSHPNQPPAAQAALNYTNYSQGQAVMDAGYYGTLSDFESSLTGQAGGGGALQPAGGQAQFDGGHEGRNEKKSGAGSGSRRQSNNSIKQSGVYEGMQNGSVHNSNQFTIQGGQSAGHYGTMYPSDQSHEQQHLLNKRNRLLNERNQLTGQYGYANDGSRPRMESVNYATLGHNQNNAAYCTGPTAHYVNRQSNEYNVTGSYNGYSRPSSSAHEHMNSRVNTNYPPTDPVENTYSRQSSNTSRMPSSSTTPNSDAPIRQNYVNNTHGHRPSSSPTGFHPNGPGQITGNNANARPSSSPVFAPAAWQLGNAMLQNTMPMNVSGAMLNNMNGMPYYAGAFLSIGQHAMQGTRGAPSAPAPRANPNLGNGTKGTSAFVSVPKEGGKSNAISGKANGQSVPLKNGGLYPAVNVMPQCAGVVKLSTAGKASKNRGAAADKKTALSKTAAAKTNQSVKKASVKSTVKPANPKTPAATKKSLPNSKPPQASSTTTTVSNSAKTPTPQTNNPPTKQKPKPPTPKRIEIPTTFSPRHTYRATAAYSLLRTLSKELRLSPFSLQSFLTALVLPIPSRLLGEVHVRVMRVLFANAEMGSYSRYGKGDGAIFLKRRSIERGESMEEIIRAKACDNLYYLDNLTWPLYYEDYAVATEEKFLNDLNDEDFIDPRSSVFSYEDAELNDNRSRMDLDKSKSIVPYPGEGWVDRCPVGPFGRRNPTTGRFVCCPFHIHAAVGRTRQGRPTLVKTDSLPKKRKRSKSPKPQTHDDSSDYGNDSSDSDSDEDYGSKAKKKPKGTRPKGRPRKYPKTETVSSVAPIKGSLVMDVQSAVPVPTSKSFPISTHVKPAISKPPPHTTTPLIMPQSNPVIPPHMNRPAPTTHKVMPQVVNKPVTSFHPILVPPIPPQPVDYNALLVPEKTEETIGRYFLEGDLFQNKTDGEEVVDASPVGSSENGTVDAVTEAGEAADSKSRLFDQTMTNTEEEELPHLAPIKILRKGTPYHLLPLEMKLRMIEFLLDELLAVDEIGKELTLRRQLTSHQHSLYGEVPRSCEFDNLVNDDECAICGLEGDLLCCDGCPGSFHRSCISMGPTVKLPEGKWLCTECRVPDASRMGPLKSDSRPLIGWFTMGELLASLPPVIHSNNTHEINGSSLTSLAQNIMSQLNGAPNQFSPNNQQQAFQQVCTAFDNPYSDISKRIPSDVEFLVSTGKVFARHRHSQKKFDPFNPFPTHCDSKVTNLLLDDKGNVIHIAQNPPKPLTDLETVQLLKLLGPEMCLKLPWRRLIFNPNQVFSSPVTKPLNETNGTSLASVNSDSRNATSIQELVLHHEEARALRADHPETGNPLHYENKYRNAPPIPSVKHHLGQFTLPSTMSETFVTHKVAAQFGLSLASTLSLCHTMDKISLPLQYVTQSIRDQLIRLGRSLFESYLLDFRWGTLDKWVDKVRRAKSFSRLSRLLLKLADACSPRAFHCEWYQIKENGNEEERARLTNNRALSSLKDGWKADEELKLRKWQRCTVANVRSLLNSEDGLKVGLTANRGKKSKPSDGIKKPRENPGDKTPLRDGQSQVTPDSLNSSHTKSSDALTVFFPPLKPTPESPSLVGPKNTNPVDDSMESSIHEDNSTLQPKSKNKKRRTTRSLSPVPPSIKKRCPDRHNAIRKQIESTLGLKISECDTEIHNLKLDTIENVLLEEGESFFFSVAGKTLFEPEGSLKAAHVKRLARNAGAVRAPFIAYESPFEVGESTICHYWRRLTQLGSTFEDFILSLRFFEGHIDKQVTASCSSITNRISKPVPATFASAIRCELIDQMTGTKEYFVVNEAKSQGKWQLEINVDLPPYISYCYEKGKTYREKYSQVMKKQLEEQAKKKAEEAKKEAEAKRLEREKKTAEAQKRHQEIMDNLNGKTRTVNIPAAKSAAKKPAAHNEHVFETELILHRDRTFEFLVASASRGEKSVSASDMAAARNKTTSSMTKINDLLKSTYNNACFTTEEIRKKMLNAEAEAVKKYVEHTKSIKKA